MQKIKELIKKYSIEDSPKESCGFIIKIGVDLKLIKCENMAIEQNSFFLISQADTKNAKSLGDIEYIWHSHAEGDFSDNDKFLSEESGIKLILYNIKENRFVEYQPCGYEIPYVGRQYLLGNLDCIQLIIDYYKRELNINLSDKKEHPVRLLSDLEHSIHNDKHNVAFEDALRERGFINVNNIKEQDVILMRFPTVKFSCHCAIYMGENKILHHVANRVSCIEVYSDNWRKLTTNVFRHHLLTQ